jgi:hypothetical protein
MYVHGRIGKPRVERPSWRRGACEQHNHYSKTENKAPLVFAGSKTGLGGGPEWPVANESESVPNFRLTGVSCSWIVRDLAMMNENLLSVLKMRRHTQYVDTPHPTS